MSSPEAILHKYLRIPYGSKVVTESDPALIQQKTFDTTNKFTDEMFEKIKNDLDIDLTDYTLKTELNDYTLITDPRLSDARTPIVHDHIVSNITDFPNDLIHDNDSRLENNAKTNTANNFTSLQSFNGIRLNGVLKVFADSPYTILDTNDVILCDTTNGSMIVTLPDAASVSGRIFKIVKIDQSVNTITVNTTSSQTISFCSFAFLTHYFTFIEIVSDGSNWHIINSSPISGFGGQSVHRIGTTPNKRYWVGGITNPSGTGAPTALRIFTSPHVFDKPVKIDQISVEIVGTQSGNHLSLGIYRDDGNVYPSSLWYDSGALSTGSAGLLAATLPANKQNLTAGLYWFCVQTDTGLTATLRNLQTTAIFTQVLGGLGGSVRHNQYLATIGSFGAFPDPYPAGIAGTGSFTSLCFHYRCI